MKNIIKRIFKFLGFRITRYRKEGSSRKTKRSNLLMLHRTNTGIYYLPTDAKGDIIANTIIKGEIFEPEVIRLASKFIKPETLVLDVGSNFGQMSILFSKMVGEKGKVHAFDADDFIFEILKKNIDVNNLNEKIIPHFGAVHDKDNELLYFPVQDFERFETYGSYGIDYKNNKGREVRSLTIDSLNLQDPISFMKVDVQGGDLQAMRGARETIRRNQMPILFEYEYHFEEELNLSFQEYVDFVAQIGYKFEKVINGHNYLIIPKR